MGHGPGCEPYPGTMGYRPAPFIANLVDVAVADSGERYLNAHVCRPSGTPGQPDRA